MNIDGIRSTHESMPKGPWRWKGLSIVRPDNIKRPDGTTIYRDEEVVSVELTNTGKVEVVEARRADGSKEYLAESWENIERLIKAVEQLQSECDEAIKPTDLLPGLREAIHEAESGNLPQVLRLLRNLLDVVGSEVAA